MNIFIILLINLFINGCAGKPKTKEDYPPTPNADRTPGHVCTVDNSDFKEYRYAEKIPYCKRNVSQETKKLIYEDYDIPEVDKVNYTIDHLIPLAIGGSNDMKNLWPEHKKVKSTRPNLEWDVYKKLEAGELTQKEAIDTVLREKFKI